MRKLIISEERDLSNAIRREGREDTGVASLGALSPRFKAKLISGEGANKKVGALQSIGSF